MIEDEMKVTKITNQLQKTKKNALIISICVSLLTCAIGISIGYCVSNGSNQKNNNYQFDSIYQEFKDVYYEDIDERTLIDGLYYGLCNSVDDKFTYYTSTQNNELQNYSSTSIGIGIVRRIYYGQLQIVRVIDGSPAEKAGLKAKDIIVSTVIDGKTYVFSEHDCTEWSDGFVGGVGTEITVNYRREGIDELISTNIKKSVFNENKVQLIDSNFEGTKSYAYFKITSFLGGEYNSDLDGNYESTAANELNKYLNNYIVEQNYTIDNLILDLRDNGGGYVSNFQRLCGLFMPNKTICGYYQYNDGTLDPLYTEPKNGYEFEKYDNVNYNNKINHYTIIVNRETASAAESFVLGMRDYKETKDKVTIVGEQSYGKGRAQKFIFPFGVNDGSMIRISFAKVLSPTNNCINKRGIEVSALLGDNNRYADFNGKIYSNEEYYDKYRSFIKGVDNNSLLSDNDKEKIIYRVNAILNKSYTEIDDAIKSYQVYKKIDSNGVFSDNNANLLADDWYEYYTNNLPYNLYGSMVIGGNDNDLYTPTQRKFVMNQINIVMNRNFENFDVAVKQFQLENSLLDKNGVFDLETSYLLSGKIFDLSDANENKIVKQAEEL